MREKILHEEGLRRVANMGPLEPAPPRERVKKDREMSALERIFGLEEAVSYIEEVLFPLEMGLPGNSERLKRVERMLVELLKQKPM